VNFTWTPSDLLARTDVQFTDLSTDTGGIVSWSWGFGDNASSPSQNPKHEYEKGGTYQVKLTVTDGDGSSKSLQKMITSATFDPSSREVQITSLMFGQTLRGTLNASEDRISGFWYDAVAGWRGEDWSVNLQ